MPKKTAPRLATAYGWTLGEGPWNVDMDANLKMIDALLGGATVISNSVPTPPGGAALTFDPSYKGAGQTLSNSNMTNTASATYGNAFSTFSLTGKVYLEYLLSATGANQHNIGVAARTTVLPTTQPANPGVLQNAFTSNWANGEIWSNGARTGKLPGTLGNTTRVCIAFDAATRDVWIRNGISGNWNGDATADPATGVGGINIGGSDPVYFFTGAGTSPYGGTMVVTDFAGTVPSGFSGPTTSALNPGDTYIIPANATGAWAGKTNQIAVYVDGAWQYIVPKRGLRVEVQSAGGFMWFNGTAWAEEPSGLLQMSVASADPTASDIPAGNVGVFKNSTTGAVKLWANDGGVLKSVQLT